MIHTVEIEDVDDIVRNELQWQYDFVLSEGGDDELLEAIQRVIEYYSVGGYE